MSRNSKKNPNPNWQAEQHALADKRKLCRVHDADAKLLKFSDGRCLRRLENGQLVHVATPTAHS